jgi:hypothetical protein
MIEALLKEIIGTLPQRSRDVLVRRGGLKNNRPETLEAIGASYGITRERVRQIESGALRLVKTNALGGEAFGDFEKLAYDYLERAGGARVEEKFLQELTFLTNDRHPASASRIRFLLQLSPRMTRYEETERRHAFWVSEATFAPHIVKFLDATVQELKKKNSPLSLADADSFLSRIAAKASMAHFPTGALVEFVHISKEISVNPYGEWGLAEWDAIVPSGVKDRAYYVLRQHRKPLHFKELAGLLNEYAKLASEFHPAWQKRVEVQTVHNELIKDGRFVLVGRGTYALREWGYRPGTVRDVIVDVLRDARRPLSREEVVKLVKAKRLVKDNTVLINLQNSKLFHRLRDGRYRLRVKGSGRGPVVREA